MILEHVQTDSSSLTFSSIDFSLHFQTAAAGERLVDDRLRNAARRALQQSGYAPLGSLECQATRGTVVMWGVVSSFYLKQLAQEVVKRVGEVQRVVNYVQVRDLKRPVGGSASQSAKG